MSSVSRALSRLGLLLPQRYQAEGRQLARTRRGVFLDPPIRCCRVWQRDFSEFETTRGGIWRLSGAVDYVADGWRRGRGKSASTTNANTPLESFAGGGAPWSGLDEESTEWESAFGYKIPRARRSPEG